MNLQALTMSKEMSWWCDYGPEKSTLVIMCGGHVKLKN